MDHGSNDENTAISDKPSKNQPQDEGREGAGHDTTSPKNRPTAPRGSAVPSAGQMDVKPFSDRLKHLPNKVFDDKGTQIVPTTNNVAGKLNVEETQRSTPRSLRKNIKATVLTFRVIVDRPNMARVQLLLCNISGRSLYFKLKSNVGSNISALPSADGEIPPHAQVRLVLTWTRPSHYEHWRDVPPPKLLITTRFMNAKGDSDISTTSIRLLARVSSSKTCHASNPPVEQLLLDAVGKSERMEVSSVLHEAAPAPEPPLKTVEARDHDDRQVATTTNLFTALNELNDRGLFILILILLTIMYIVSKMYDKNDDRQRHKL